MTTNEIYAMSRKRIAQIAVFVLASYAMVGSFAADAVSAIDAPHVTTLPGQSATLMPNGQWLLIGGDNEASRAKAELLDTRVVPSIVEKINVSLKHPRGSHTATVLPNGAVLVFGGTDAKGNVVEPAEIYDPLTKAFQYSSTPGLTVRARHSATLLTDGRVLIAGGIDKDGRLIEETELWNPQTKMVEKFNARLVIPRFSHHAQLLPSSPVLLSGGQNSKGRSIEYSEWYDPKTQRFNKLDERAENILPSAPLSAFQPAVEASIPRHGEQNVPISQLISMRFSKHLRVDSVNAETITLMGPLGQESIKVVPAESGMLAFVAPQAQLLPGSYYTLFLRGPTDASGNRLPFTAIGFSTETLSGQSASVSTESVVTGADMNNGMMSVVVHDDEEWHPMREHRKGNWRSGRVNSLVQTFPPLKAKQGVTALSGQVVLLSGKPLSDVTLMLGKQSVTTDETGRFLIANISSGHQELFINGHTADKPGKTYGKFIVGVDVTEKVTNVLPYTVWMPKLDMKNAVTIASPTADEVVLSTPDIPGLEVRIPAGAVIRDRAGKVVTQVGLTAIPVDQPPYPLPEHIQVPIYFTIQPGDAFIQNISVTGARGARIIYPNYINLPPGTQVDFWHYDPREKGWHIYGQGTVTDDGKQVVPDPGVSLYEFTGAMFSPRLGGGTPPPEGPPPNGCKEGQAGDPVDCATGLFVYEHTDMVVRDIMPLSITRTYRTNDTISRAFGIGTNFPYGMFLSSASYYTEADLILPDGGKIHYVRISAGSGYADAVFEHTTSSTVFYKSRLAWNGNGWDLTLKDGTVYVFGENQPLQAIRDRNGNSIRVTRSSGGQSGNITRLTSPSGRFVDFTYDASNRITQVKDNIGRTVSYVYDATGRLIKVTDPAGGITEYTYDAAHRMLTVKNPRGFFEVTNEYDANGRAKKQTHADGGVFLFTYVTNELNKVTQTDVTYPRGSVRRMVFNPQGYITKETNALGAADEQIATYEREAFSNRILSSLDALNRKTSYVYDYQGNLTSLTRMVGTAAAATTTFTYEPIYNQVATVTDPLSHTTRFDYDAKGNLVKITDALNNVTQFGYNEKGQRTTITNALNKATTLQYSLSDLSGLVDALNRKTTLFTDDVGRVLNVANALGQATRYDYDALDRVTKVTDPNNGITQYGYDTNSNVTSVIDPKNGSTTFAYNNRDTLQTRTDPLIKAEGFIYDTSDNPTQHTDRKGQITRRTFDGLERLKTITYADGGTVTYTYDKGNRVTQIADSVNGTLTYSYDDVLRKVVETTPQGQVTYLFDAAGRRASTAVTGQPAITYGYDNANRLTSLVQGTQTVSFTYDAANRKKTQTLPNGVSEEYGYDDAGQLTSSVFKKGATILGDITHTYDNAGRRLKAGGSYARQGLPATQSTTAYNAANQLTNWKGVVQSYDLNGNLTSDGTKTYTWNTRNQLTGISGGGITASYQYDAQGRRRSKTVNGATTNFLYDGQNVIQELTGTTPKANLLPGLNLDEVFARTEGAATSYYLTDALGSTLALTDAVGTVQTQYTYEPFGNTAQSGVANNSAFQYTGRENDGTGLYYYRARYYSPSTQRFISQDPIGFAGGDVNLYGYVGNNPVSYVDPRGLATTVVINNNNAITGTHAGVVVGSGSNTVLYDPGGTYGGPTKGSGDALSGSSINLADYVAYQKKDGPDVQIYTFATTPAQEAEIVSRIEKNGSMGPGFCAIETSSVLNGIGPFKGLGISLTPSGLGRSLGNIR